MNGPKKMMENRILRVYRTKELYDDYGSIHIVCLAYSRKEALRIMNYKLCEKHLSEDIEHFPLVEKDLIEMTEAKPIKIFWYYE